MSIVLALVVSAVFYQMSTRGARSKPKQVEFRDVVTAAQPLPVGTSVRREELKITKIPADLFPHGGFSKVEEVIDRPVVSNVLLDEPVLEGRLAARGSGMGLAPIWPKSGSRSMYAVTVERDLEPIRRLLKETFPSEAIDIRADRDSLVLVGSASNPGVAERAMALVAPLVKTVVNNLQVVPPGADKQIILRVKIAEIDRNVAKSFGINLLSTGAGNTPGRITTGQFPSGTPSVLTAQIPGALGGTTTNFSLSDVLNIFAFRPDLNLGVLIKDLQAQGVLQILAEPNLVTTNGKEASFLVGGEFPVPVVQGGQNAGAITIVFREFGIRLTFLPQVTAHNTIKMHVKPEVSTIDLSNGVVFSGFTIPALATRRIETDIELGEGQSFVIAGLMDDRVTENLSQVPGLSHIPILGELFKSRSETKSKTELVVMVTPESVYLANLAANRIDVVSLANHKTGAS
jgi:pilus assembly protein CpaC